ncbi:hypothetical protein B0H14DRAFT_3767620 [Mycena olivaceomarginata]|nr:hypothetical protein B0H14DRAFT_3767620 [Mycena olivaceomarginata]
MATHHIATMLPPAWGHTVSYSHSRSSAAQQGSQSCHDIIQHRIMDGERAIDVVPFGPTVLNIALAQLSEGWLSLIPQLDQGSEGWPNPHAIHIMGPDCKTLLWFCCAAVSMIAHFNEYDHDATTQKIYADETRRGGRTMDEILQQVGAAWNGDDKLTGIIVKHPGAPDMYDHERVAYASGPADIFGVLLGSAQRLAKLVDGYIIPSGTYFEPVGVPYCREYYKKRGQELFTVGLQTHELAYADGARIAPSNERVRAFLEDAASKYGPQSVLYISFGYVSIDAVHVLCGRFFFPIATPQLIEALVNTLLALEKPFPFIFALGGKMASLPKDLTERVNASGRGLVCDFWVEQQAILQHRALGWFFTHGGFNSVTESLTRGIPLIVWPSGAEQPVNAAFLSTGQNPVAIELFQIRTGPQLAPSLRGGPTITGTVEDATKEFREVFDTARGKRGEALKANALRMARAIREARTGECADEIIRLARFLGQHWV